MPTDLPVGTVTFLFTDIEGSTRLWEQHPTAMQAALARHDDLLHGAIEAHHGTIIKTTGDGVHAAFARVLDCIEAVIAGQGLLQVEAWPGTGPLKVRMGVHTGEAELRAGDYYGPALNRAARLMSAAHGGQILVSNASAELGRDRLPAGAALRDLGEHRLKDLVRPEHVYQLVHPNLLDEFPPIKSIDAFPNNLPIQLTSFVGREKEMGEVQALLKASRLVTLTGSGGTGKTRLALEVGAQELGSFAHGVWLIELAPLADPAQIIPALAQVFGLQELPYSPLASLVSDYLRDKQLLLLLDNCEHLIEACARLADELLHQCARLKILASSREGLGIAGEVAYRIPSLEEAEATLLFVERAQAANPRFNRTEANAPAIAKICARLDGIPLAIELAAARSRVLAPEQIAARLDDRFRLLVGGSRTALPRQQTLRALIDWSYDLLSEEERRLLRSASVFVGGWTLDALEAVSDDPNAFEHLDQLVNKSLVVTEERQNEMRYSLLETIRQYAREKLFDSGRTVQVRDRHLSYFESFSEKMWAAFISMDVYAWQGRVETEWDNCRAAMEWGLDHHPESALSLAWHLCTLSSMSGNQPECQALLLSALQRVRAQPPAEGEVALQRQILIARALLADGSASMNQGNVRQAAPVFQEAIAISRLTGDRQTLGFALQAYASAADYANLPGGPEAAQEGLELLTGLNDQWGIFMANINMARIATLHGDLQERQSYLRKNQELIEETPSSIQSGLFLLQMGMDERFRGNRQAARPYFEEGLKVFRQLRHKNYENVMLSELGHIARLSGDLEQATQIYQQTIVRWQDLGHRSAIAHQLECFAFLAIAENHPRRAAKLFGAAEALREKLGSPMSKFEQMEYDPSMAQLRSLLEGADLYSIWAEGRALTMEQAIQLALSRIP